MTLIRLQFIKQAQSLGMSLSEIKEFLTVRDRIFDSVSGVQSR